MILFFACGRLGNQLFQYAALKEVYPKHELVFFGFDDLHRALELVDAIVIEKEKMPRGLMFSLRKLFAMLAMLRIIGSIAESRENGAYHLRQRRGVVPGLYCFKPSFFQHAKILEQLNPDFDIADGLVQSASRWLKVQGAVSAGRTRVFVHVRRGDYLSWPTCERPAVLGKQWYRNAMEEVRSIVADPLFIVLTDDICYAEGCFGDQPDILISHNNKFVDLALMASCELGILSASSFAWWGAWLSRKRHDNKGIYLAPKYWAGHRWGEWRPKGFITHWITYIEMRENSSVSSSRARNSLE